MPPAGSGADYFQHLAPPKPYLMAAEQNPQSLASQAAFLLSQPAANGIQDESGLTTTSSLGASGAGAKR